MKRLWIVMTTVLAVISPVLAIIPAVADNSMDGMPAGNKYVVEPLAFLSTLNANGSLAGTLISSRKSAAKSSSSPLTAHAGNPLVFNISAADPDNNTLIYSASNLPPGATFDPLTGAFAWTPGYDQAGVYPNIHFEVSDGELTDSEDITITVVSSNRPPVLNGIGNKSGTEQKQIQFAVAAADPDNDALTYSASNLPAGAAFSPQTRAFSWTPNTGQQGTYAGVHFEVSDGKQRAFEDITITVAAASVDLIPPVISGVAAAGITINGATISWQTNELSNSKVLYWTSSNNATLLSANLVTNHVVNLTNLSPNTTYSYKVISADAAGNTAEQSGGTFTTLIAASFSVSALSVNPDSASTDRKVTIRVTAKNSGSVAGTYTVTLKINGAVEAAKTVTISPGASVTVSFTTQKSVAGTYTVDVNGLSDSFQVTAAGRTPGRKF